MTREIPENVRQRLASIYEEVMWLAERPNIRPAAARAWYTHIVHPIVRRELRLFTGKVSQKAVTDETAPLRLEHFKRIQTTLTQLVDRHTRQGIRDADEFIATVIEFEQVHIVTAPENYAAMRAKGDYERAQIKLVAWKDIPPDRRRVLWKKMLKGKVANALDYAVEPFATEDRPSEQRRPLTDQEADAIAEALARDLNEGVKNDAEDPAIVGSRLLTDEDLV